MRGLIFSTRAAGEMDPYQVFRAARILLLVLLGLFFLFLARGKPLSQRLRILLLAVVTGAVLSFPNFGFFHVRWGHIHYWDAFHYFTGAKYLPELGYSGLYDATFVAGRDLGAFGSITEVRNLKSYALRDVGSIDAEAVRRRFSADRWLDFKRDLAFFGPHITLWDRLLVDHGYNDPLPRALLLHFLLRSLPANTSTLTLLTSFDYCAIIVAFYLVRRAFGPIPTALAIAFFSLSFFGRFDFIGGSILRWDWVAALLAGVAAFARGRGGTAGIFLGYAALARIFPALFLVPLGIKWLQRRWNKERDVALSRCLGSATALVLVVATGLVASGEGRSLLPEFLAKMRLHAEVPFSNSVGLSPLIAFTAAPWSMSPEGNFVVAHAAVLAARPAPWVPLVVSVLYLLVALPLILRARPLESIMYSVPLIFCALSLTGYYYAFLVLLVLLPWWNQRADRFRLIEMALITAIMAVSYAFELHSDEHFPLFYQASIQLGVFFFLWIGFEYARLRSEPDRAP